MTVHRVEVRPKEGIADPRAADVARCAAALGLAPSGVRTAKVYLVESALSPSQLGTLCERLLADPVTEIARPGAAPADARSVVVEVHPLPGVMDPAAQSVRDAVRDLLAVEARVSTGQRFDLTGVSAEDADRFARAALANPVVHRIHLGPYVPDRLPAGTPTPFALRHVPIRDLDDAGLQRLSREGHLFLSLDEMRAIQAEFRRVEREPTDAELETLAQTWSEHCVHKTLKSAIRYRHGREPGSQPDPIRWTSRPGHEVHPDGTVTIDNLLKRTVAAATHELIADGVDWTLSVFKDNSGVVALDDRHAVCIKVETHNHPSALEPYGGSATGAGGCIRDVIGTGLGAKPIANTDVFCVAMPGGWEEGGALRPLPPGCLHPRRVLTDVVAGVRDYGNRMGIPTVAGAVAFDDRYVGNPLVFCGCVGLLPRDLVHGGAHAGDRIIAIGGRTGRDGIHGATFSSAELEEGHADEFSHAVQIGNAIEEKRVLDAILRARDAEGGPLYTAITDCGAGGFSSAVGEMGSRLGAQVELERAPLKYDGLTYTEVWISEAQERMVLAVPPANVPALEHICREEGVELADLGVFGTPNRELVLRFDGHEVGRLSMDFLHEGIPMPRREATWATPRFEPVAEGRGASAPAPPVGAALLDLLGHPTIASKHWIIRQYDHEVQGNTIIKPLVGLMGRGPGSGAVLEPVPGSGLGVALACGLATGVGDPRVGGDTYQMALAAIDECVRNLVCLGADPDRIAILDNFCWPSCAKAQNLASLVRAAEGCYDGAKAYRTPFVSGKDSLNNQLRYKDPRTGEERTIEIPPTLLITGLGIVPDVSRSLTSEAKQPGDAIVLVGPTQDGMGGSIHQAAIRRVPSAIPGVDLALGPRLARAVHGLIRHGLVRSAHDASEGGVLVALAEMLIGGPRGLGAAIDLSRVHADPTVAAFGESPSRYLLEVRARDLPAVERSLAGLPWCVLGFVDESGRLRASADSPHAVDAEVEALAQRWLSPLDW
ncbi:MAG: phosphoribosylformylglycinamidine synthase subunit PurS [Phycisphaerae bacterium]|nr:phosphoribosylformylglycinamidine synthase subunit PurS [Phycisphaerae bacterium]